jgi:hypothetical protein
MSIVDGARRNAMSDAMSDEVRAEPAGKTDPLFAHLNLTEEGIARAPARREEPDKTKHEDWDALRRRMGLER